MELVSSGFGITLWGGRRVVEWKSNPMKQVGSGFGITSLSVRRMVGKIQRRNGFKRAFYNKKAIIYNLYAPHSTIKKHELCKLHKNNQKK